MWKGADPVRSRPPARTDRGRPGRGLHLFLLAAAAGLTGLMLAVTSAAASGLLAEFVGSLGLGRARPYGFDPEVPVDPDRRYHLVVWDYRLPFTSPGGAPFPEATERAIRRFQSRHPNVTVDLVVLDPADGQEQLAQALAAGYPPDVYCSPFGPPAVGSALQVPVGLYLDYETWARYHPVAWQAVKVDGTVWAWPRWLVLWPWLGNETLLERAGLDVESLARDGWTWEDLAAAAEALSGLEPASDRRPTLAASAPAVVFRDLLFTWHLAAETAPEPETFWLGPAPAEAARFLEELRELRALGSTGTGRNPGVLDSFVHGRTALLVNPSPWATMFLAEVVPRQDPWQFSVPSREGRPPMVLLPAPARPGSESPGPVVWVSAAPVMVFRQARYRGDDNTRLAMDLAREITLGTRPWLRDLPFCVPAEVGEMAAWRLGSERFGPAGELARNALERLASLPEDRLSLALTALQYGPWAPEPGRDADAAPSPDSAVTPGTAAGHHGYLGPFLGEVVQAVLELWEGDLSSEDLTRLVGGHILKGP
ncbi:MAG TPA: hypothetical protein DHW14_08460 [Clostridiales bacterium]|nr:hypothetical protein [Clostridiales bacterium]